jgi:hypothetical protein
LDRKSKDSSNPIVTIENPLMKMENEADMSYDETKDDLKNMASRIQISPESPETAFQNKSPSCYEFQEIANVEGWSSMDNDHFMTVNDPSQYDLSFGQYHNSTAVDEIAGINDKNTVNY